MKIWACILSNNRFMVIQLLEISGNPFAKATPTLLFSMLDLDAKYSLSRNTAMLPDSIWGQGESPSKTHGRCILKISNAPKQLFVCSHLASGKCILHCMVAFHQESSSLANRWIYHIVVPSGHLVTWSIESTFTESCSHGSPQFTALHSDLLHPWGAFRTLAELKICLSAPFMKRPEASTSTCTSYIANVIFCIKKFQETMKQCCHFIPKNREPNPHLWIISFDFSRDIKKNCRLPHLGIHHTHQKIALLSSFWSLQISHPWHRQHQIALCQNNLDTRHTRQQHSMSANKLCQKKQ